METSLHHKHTTHTSCTLSPQEVSSPRSKLYKVNADVLKFLKRKKAEEKLKRMFPEQVRGKKIVRVKVKKPNWLYAEQSEWSDSPKVEGYSVRGTFRTREECLYSKNKVEDGLKLQISDQNTPHSFTGNDHTSLDPSHQILSKLSNIKGSVHEIIEEVNHVIKGQGRVSFVAVRGSGQVSRVTEKAFIPVPQDSSVLADSIDSDDEGVKTRKFSPNCVETGSAIILSECDHSPLGMSSNDRSGECVRVQVEGIPKNEESQEDQSDGSSSVKPLSRMPYKCKRCKSKPFSTQLELDLHMSCHVTQGPDLLIYRCPEASCSVERRCYPRIVEHLIMQHPAYERRLQGTQTYDSVAGSFQCDLCPSLEFKLKVNLQHHMKKVHGCESEKSRVFSRKCDRCGSSFRKMSLAAFHLHRERCCYEYRCSQCEYRTNKLKNIELHLKVHTGEGFKCRCCDKLFASKARLNAHAKIHLEDRPKFVCDVCQGEFTHHDALKKHRRRMHEQVEKLKCPQCPYETKMRADLNKHELFVHRKVFHCTFEGCEFQTNSPKFWTEHSEYHRPENVYGCLFEDCYYRAETEEKVSCHQYSFHKINAKHRCPVCSKFFFKKTQLMRHVVTHAGGSGGSQQQNHKGGFYSCLECKATFGSHTSYYKHRHKTGHDVGREGIVSVPQNIQITQYQKGEEGSGSGGMKPSEIDPMDTNADVMNVPTNLVVAADGGIEQNPVVNVMYSTNDDSSGAGGIVLPINQISNHNKETSIIEESFAQGTTIQVINLEDHGIINNISHHDQQQEEQEISVNHQDTKVIYMDDCDEATKAMILKELQKGYSNHNDHSESGENTAMIHYDAPQDSTNQFVTISPPEDHHVLLDEGQSGGIVLYDPVVHGEGIGNLTQETTAGFHQMMDDSSGMFAVENQGHSVQFDVAGVVNSSNTGSVEETGVVTLMDTASLNVMTGDGENSNSVVYV